MNLPAILQPAVKARQLMVSVSGIRAILPQGLEPLALTELITAFADTTGSTIVIGRDSRPSGQPISNFIQAILELRGKHIINVGVAPTPTVKAIVANSKANAGIIVTASHNPEEWNGLKFLGKGGFFYNADELNQLLGEVETHSHRPNPKIKPGKSMKLGNTETSDGIGSHIEAIVQSLPNTAAIRRRKFKVVVDAVGGAGREALPRLLKELGCKVIPLYCDVTESFPRPPEPTPAALREFSKIIQKEQVAVGFALDPDADRLVTGSPTRGALNEEYTLPLAFLGKKSSLKRAGTLVVNLSTSTLLDSVAGSHRVIRSAVGEANVVAQMIARKALFGGEGNGGVIDPSIPSFGRDSLIGAALILSALESHRSASIDDLTKIIPELFMSKAKLPLDTDVDSVLQRFEQIGNATGKLAKTDRTDGLHLTFHDHSWVHLRPSNTEPILRLIAQAGDKNSLQQLLTEFK